mmetsp:Transcript_11360/g.19148  ORF Transcript_11360/g.19148 Transcript_11360/m.19148 type:complete len:448 (-) Transcript_11360:58-1401(-)
MQLATELAAKPYEYKVERRRWLVLGSYAGALTAQAYVMTTFSPIASIVSEIYLVPSTVVSSCVIVFLLAFIFLNFAAVSALERLGIALTFRMCGLTTIVGVWARYFLIEASGDFFLLLAGQAIVAVANPFLCNGVSKLASNWFGDEERALATSVGSLATPLGCILGLSIGPIFINDQDKADPAAGKAHMNAYMLFTAGLCSLLSLPIVFLMKERPEEFPSEAAREKFSRKEEYSQMKDLRELVKNWNYIFLSLNFMMLYGVYTCLGAVINNIVAPYGFTATDSSVLGGAFILSGLVGSFFFSALLDKRQQYLKIVRIICFATLFFTAVSLKTLPTGSLLYFAPNIALLGFFILPIIPVGYSFAIELTYPASEAMSNGILMLLSQIVGSGVTYGATVMSEKEPLDCVYLFLAMQLVSCLASLFIKEDLRRVKGAGYSELDVGAREAES